MAHQIGLQHTDLITSVAFSGTTLLATASLDHSIRVTCLNPSTNTWDLNPLEWKAHDAPVLKLAWAHPEFGVILASGGVDGVVKLWAQQDVRPSTSSFSSVTPTPTGTNGGGGPGGGASTKRWVQRAALTDARGTCRDVAFSPPEFGLKLAAISSDSHLRVWECLDPVSLTDWSLIFDIDLLGLPLGTSSSTTSGASLSTGPGGVPIPSGGAGGGAGGGFESGGPGAASPNKGQGSLMGSVGSGAGASMASSAGSGSSFEGRRGGTIESDGGWSLSWCKEAWWGERLAVSAGTSGLIRVRFSSLARRASRPGSLTPLKNTQLFHLPDHGPWSNYLNLLPPRANSSFAATPPTSSLAWAPASGRSYQLLASGSRDGRARIWKLYPPSLEGEDFQGGVNEEWKGDMDAELEESKSARGGSVGSVKVEWNVTGTVLSTVRLGTDSDELLLCTDSFLYRPETTPKSDYGRVSLRSSLVRSQ